MKKLSLCLMATCALVILSACSSRTYKVIGTIDGAKDGDTLFLSYDMESGMPSDTILVKDGKFMWTGQADSLQLCLLYLQSNHIVNSVFFIEPGEINIHLSPQRKDQLLSGTPTNEQWRMLNDSVEVYGKEINQAVNAILENDALSPEKKSDSTQVLLNGKYKQMNQCIVNFAENNITNEFGLFLLNYYGEDVIDSLQRQRLIKMMPKELASRLGNN
ncbi:MAG: DUF4369 domain-containing protein [Prevotella sp.]|nr:DUF4369 domain-containing protein [Prevotella sp.]MBQ6210811.1 DUF4369 domain-containing protein [Prevotella sp.]